MTKFLAALLPLAFILSACETAQVTRKKSVLARVTYYTGHEDKFGKRVACSKSRRAKQGRTVAAPSKYPFWTKLFFPQLQNKVGDGHLVVEDRGHAVETRKAAHFDPYTDVFDVFLDMPNKQMRRFANSQPAYMPVIIEQ